MAERCFFYNALLLFELKAPAPAGQELVYRVMHEGREVNAWRFDVVRLWEMKAETALASGAAGLLALVPLLEGGDPAAVWMAARRIRQLLPEERMSDPESILWLLAEQRYNEHQLSRAVGRRNMQALLDLLRQSPLWQKAEAEGENRGRAEGKARGIAEGKARGIAEGLAAQRATLLKLLKRHHPELLARAAPRIAECSDPARLEVWTLAASEPDPDAFARLLDEAADLH
jgi:predicted transposase YdaD